MFTAPLILVRAMAAGSIVLLTALAGRTTTPDMSRPLKRSVGVLAVTSLALMCIWRKFAAGPPFDVIV